MTTKIEKPTVTTYVINTSNGNYVEHLTIEPTNVYEGNFDSETFTDYDLFVEKLLTYGVTIDEVASYDISQNF